jgi:hypothetical protein
MVRHEMRHRCSAELNAAKVLAKNASTDQFPGIPYESKHRQAICILRSLPFFGPLSVPEPRRQIEVSETFCGTSQNVLPTPLATSRSFPLHVALTPYAVCALPSYHGKAFKDLR